MLQEKNLKELLNNTKKLQKILLNLSGLRIGLITHKNADPDALASIYVLREFLQARKNYTYLFFPEGLNSTSKYLLNKLGLTLEYYKVEYGKYMDHLIDYYVIVDTSNSVQLGDLGKIIQNKCIVIDHHHPGDLFRKCYHSLVVKLTSTSELLYFVLENIWYFSSISATLLLSGMLYDTRRFIYVDKYTFYTANELINKYSADYSKALEGLHKEMDLAERIARLKGAQRLILKRYNDIIVTITHVSAFEGSVARSLIELGADAAFVVSSNDKLRIVGRATKLFVQKTRISLGRDIMPKIGKLINGEGGGHDTAGVAEGKGSLKQGLKVIEKVLNSLLSNYTK
ncbi:MAG: DHH family phosphoesterase [Staphylothermus sp.]|nr:DHH family phosphoesterase [Staphylothermus sp.]